MAEKKVFFSNSKFYFEEKIIEYKYYSGFAVSQKQKSIASLHQAILESYPDKNVLEISTKSPNPLGVQLSAFNLLFHHRELSEERNLENIFQYSKVFENGGPYRDLLQVHPRDAKRDQRLRESGNLISFNLYGEDWPLEPKTAFYDWIYISALKDNMALTEELLEYDVFTDIEFNHKKSINCQARAAAIFVALCKNGELEKKTKDKDSFITIYSPAKHKNEEQLSLF
jgi:type I restriction enzyme M protein